LLTTLLFSSPISELRAGGAGGANCQWSTASPALVAQKAICATRKSPVAGGLENAPEAKDIEADGTVLTSKMHCV
jgi:hypothetical protein